MEKHVCDNCGAISYASIPREALKHGCNECGWCAYHKWQREEGLFKLDHEFRFDLFRVFMPLVSGIRQLAVRLNDSELSALVQVLERKETETFDLRLREVSMARMCFTRTRMSSILKKLTEVAPDLPETLEFAAVGQFRENIRSNGFNKPPTED